MHGHMNVKKIKKKGLEDVVMALVATRTEIRHVALKRSH
jgi:hypothetical protein